MIRAVELKKYIGRPYDRYNCFDLVKEFYMDHFNLDLKYYFESDIVPDRKTVASLIVSNIGDFVPVVGEPEFGDLVIIRLFGVECHMGVAVGPKQFIHSARGIGSTLDRLERFKHMIVGYYRHRYINDKT